MEGADVKFSNTDGMAFIGPGSEWFWTAVSGIVLAITFIAITFIAIYRQLRGQREQARHNTQLLRSQAHYNALMIEHRPWEMFVRQRRLGEHHECWPGHARGVERGRVAQMQ